MCKLTETEIVRMALRDFIGKKINYFYTDPRKMFEDKVTGEVLEEKQFNLAKYAQREGYKLIRWAPLKPEKRSREKAKLDVEKIVTKVSSAQRIKDILRVFSARENNCLHHFTQLRPLKRWCGRWAPAAISLGKAPQVPAETSLWNVCLNLRFRRPRPNWKKGIGSPIGAGSCALRDTESLLAIVGQGRRRRARAEGRERQADVISPRAAPPPET
jgi:hypothetical protein